MRSALLCVFFTLIIHKEVATTPDDDFRPIPIPLDEWNYEKRQARVGTLHEAIQTDKPPTVAAVPAHYWEDALRHSVYLTLVRDKIDQLIAKGAVVSSDSKQDQHASKEVDDHDLWEKIKKAPFDRIEADDHPSFGDVTIMAKGRLLEENGGFRFTEDERSKEVCSDDKCMEGVKAFWSVKRVRQRDVETSPGRYHYELTFSVNSNKPKKQKRPYENPVRTFTVRENPPDIIVGTPQEHHIYQPIRPQIPRPQRAIWFHRNIAPTSHFSQPRYFQSLESIFTSFFSDDDSHVEPPPRYKTNPYLTPMMPQFSKAGYVGLPSDQHQQKRLMTYVYKPNLYKYSRPPLPAPPVNNMQHYHVDTDVILNNPQLPPTPPDHRYLSPSNLVKTTRPAVLPTPSFPNPNTTQRNANVDVHNNKIISENFTKDQEFPMVHKTYSKPRPTPMRVGYFPEHIRPPVYNAPPGVFVNMDKKPFKPMPPLKYVHPTKSAKKPIDFRPSPQILDGQFSDPADTPPVDSAFRPILVNFTDSDHRDTDNYKHNNKNTRKQTSKKPPKKHENIKAQRITTTAPDIITVNNNFEEDNGTMEWADVLGAFTKTTPMEPQKEKATSQESTTEPSYQKEIKTERSTSSSTERNEDKKISSTSPSPPAPKKRRTRPPHKFQKPDIVKKHKRVTTTKAPETKQKKTSDLTPQASSAATEQTHSWKNKNKTTTTTPAITTIASTTQKQTTTTTQTPTTAKVVSTTTTASTTTEEIEKNESSLKQTQVRRKNRFRISTLMQKGTSVKHDKWNITPVTDKKASNTSSKSPPRRKGSNFQGYASTSEPNYRNKEEESHRHISSETEIESDTIRKIETSSASKVETLPKPTQPTYEETGEHYNTNSELTSEFTLSANEDNDDIEVKGNNDEEIEPEDHSEFIFTMTSTAPNEKTNEIDEDDALIVTEQPIIATTLSVSKNKTKCKKKKTLHLTQNKAPVEDVPTTTTTIATTTKSSTGIDILDELLGGFSYDDAAETQKPTKPSELDEEESENHEKYLDQDFDDFLDNLGGRHRHHDEEDDVDYEDDEKEPIPDDDISPFDNDDADEAATNSSDKDYDDYRERSYSLLELMAME